MATLPIYPPVNTALQYTLNGLTFTQKWTPTFFNQSFKATNGASIDIGMSPYPIHEFELSYELLRDDPNLAPSGLSAGGNELRLLLGFYMQMNGSRGRFVYDNLEDNLVTAQAIGVGDGTTRTFTIVRTYGFGAYTTSATEPIGEVNDSAAAPNGGTVNVYLAGVLQGSGFTISKAVPGRNTLTFTVAPGVGVHVTMDFAYYYYCQFAEDSTAFEKFSHARWQATSVKFRSCRAGA